MATDKHFVLEIRPRAMPRPRAKAGQRAYFPASYRKWREQAVEQVEERWKLVNRGRKIRKPVRLTAYFDGVSITVWIDPIVGESKRPRLTGDLDNYGKALLDCLVDGGVLEDDRLVEELTLAFGPGRENDDE